MRIRVIIFTLVGMGVHVCRYRGLVRRARFVLRLMALLAVLRCPMVAALTVAGALAGPMQGAVLLGSNVRMLATIRLVLLLPAR